MKREWLKQLRAEKNLKQRDVYIAAGISAGLYSDIENGNNNPTLERAVKISDAIGFPFALWEDDARQQMKEKYKK